MAWLQHRVDGSWRTVFAFDAGETTKLGRSKTSDVVICDPHCSRCQAEIYAEDGSWYIRDVGSQNGTQVSGEVVSGPTSVSHGDILKVGNCDFLFLTKLDSRAVGSVSAWVQNLQHESKVGQAQFELWKRYFDRLSGIARNKLGDLPRRIADEEDAVAGAFHSFFQGVQNGRFDELGDRSDLWSLLTTITARKVCRQIERETAQKRGGGHVLGESVLGDDSKCGLDKLVRERTDLELQVEFEDTWRHYIDDLPTESHRQIVELRLAGFANAEIGRHLGIPLRTVERRLQAIRKLWDERFISDSA